MSGRPSFADTSPSRRRNMAAIRGKHTVPEVAVRRLLHRMGYRFRLHRRDLPGTPDIVLPSRRVLIEVRGCFWHRHQGCRFASTPASRTEFWQAKFDATVARDVRNELEAEALGWRTLVVWECELAAPDLLQERLRGSIGPARASAPENEAWLTPLR